MGTKSKFKKPEWTEGDLNALIKRRQAKRRARREKVLQRRVKEDE